MPYPAPNSCQNFSTPFVPLVKDISHNELMTVVPIPLSDFVCPVAAVVFGERFTMRVHEGTHHFFIIEGGRVDGGDGREILRVSESEGHSS